MPHKIVLILLFTVVSIAHAQDRGDDPPPVKENPVVVLDPTVPRPTTRPTPTPVDPIQASNTSPGNTQPKRKRLECKVPRQVERARIHSVVYDRENTALLVTIRNTSSQKFSMKYWSTNLFDAEGKPINATTIGRGRNRLKDRPIIKGRPGMKPHADTTFAIVSPHRMDEWKLVYQNNRYVFEDHPYLDWVFALHEVWLFNQNGSIRFYCKDEVIFQFPEPEVESEGQDTANAPRNPYTKGTATITWASLKSAK